MKRLICLIIAILLPIYISSCNIFSSYSDENVIDNEVSDLAECILEKFDEQIFIEANEVSGNINIRVICKSDEYIPKLSLIIPIMEICNNYLRNNPDFLDENIIAVNFSSKSNINGEAGSCYFHTDNVYENERYNQLVTIIPYVDINDINLSELDDIREITLVDSNVEDVIYAIEALNTIQTVVVNDNEIKDLLDDAYPDVVFIVR